MKKNNKILICIISALTLICLVFLTSLNYLMADTINEQIQYNDKIIEDDFENDEVLVVINKTSNTKLWNYSAADFKEIDCSSVNYLTQNYSNFDSFSKDEIDNIEGLQIILRLNLKIKSKENVLNVIKELNKRDDVVDAYPNYIGRIENIETESNIEEDLWNMNGQYGINARYATNLGGSEEVKIAILDTGIDGSHPALKGRLSETNHKDFVKNDGFCIDLDRDELNDVLGHGTHVAGIIAAESDKLNGICENVKLFSYKVAADNGRYNDARIIMALEVAASNGIELINLSLAGNASSAALENKIKWYKGLVICSSGNLGNNIDEVKENGKYAKPSYPSNFELDNILSVGATKSDGTKAEIEDWGGKVMASNYGKDSVDIFAPGTDIYSTTSVAKGSYIKMNGTSMAAPHVTGVAALIKSIVPNINARDLKDAILSNCDTDYRLKDYCTTGGRLNAWKAVSSVAYKFDSKGMITGLNTSPKREILIPSILNNIDITGISKDVFANTDITEVTFEEYSPIKIIEESAFKNCAKLNNIELPYSLLKIGKSAFENTSISQICIPKYVSEIGDCAFYNNANLKIVEFTQNSQLSSIGSSAFSNCTNLSSIDLGENSQLTSIGKRAFKNCALSEIEIPKNVTTLGAYIFEDCENLATIHFNAHNCDDCISTSNVFGGTGSNSLEVVFSNTVEKIPAYLFYSIQNLASVDIGDNVSAIGENAFYHTGLTNIVLPGNITSVGDGSFSYCRSLTDVTIQDGVKTIGTYAFDRCSLTSLFIPKSVTQIGQSAFIQCNFATITVEAENPNYKSDGNCLIEKNSNKLLFGCSYSVIPDYVTSIGNSAFAGYSF